MSMLKRTILFWVIIYLSQWTGLYSQEDKQTVRQLFVEAESFFLFEEYKDALPLYQKIMRQEPENYNVLYKIGICYLNDIYQKSKSIRYLEQATLHINQDYKTNTYREKGAPLEVLFYLGKAYRINYMFDEAIKSFQRFKNLANTEEFDIELVDYEIASCQLAKDMKNNPVYFRSMQPGPSVNSNFAESNPIMSDDGRSLVFTRQLQFYDGVFITQKDQKGNWSEPYNLTSDFQLDGNSLATGISNQGDEIFVYRSDEFDGNIYSSKYENKKWGKLLKLNDNINTKYWESHASPSPDGQYLYFSSNRSGSYGGLDIFRSKKGKNGSWGTAMNLGAVINTSFNEDVPFVSNNGQSLFFSSQGHNTMGGYDVFVSNMQVNGQWTQPKNMGYPLNTADDDLYFCPSGINSYGYLSKYDENSSKGLMDIYLVEFFNDLFPREFTLKGEAGFKNMDSESLNKVRARLLKKRTNELIDEIKLASDGSFAFKAPQGSYILLIDGENVQPYTQSIDLAVAQSESIVTLPSILLEKASATGEAIATIQPAKQVIMAKSTFYSVNDSTPVKIELTLPENAKLHIDIQQNNIPSGSYNLQPNKKKYTYLYKPKPGENLLKFASTDPDGNVSTTEVLIKYVQKEELLASDTLKPTQPVTPKNGVYSILTPDKLKEYMSGLNMDDFSDIFALYQHLLSVADKEGISKAEIDKMLSIYFTQKNLALFERELKKQVTINDSLLKQAKDSSSIPLQFIERLVISKSLTDDDLNNGLIGLLDVSQGNALGVVKALNLYSLNKCNPELAKDEMLSEKDGFLIYKKNTSEKDAREALYLAATSENLEFFRQNLILASEGTLRKYLTNLNTESPNINTSVDLVAHLFENVDKKGYTAQELIKALELAAVNKQYYLQKFNDLLTYKAEGTIKSQLQLLDLESENIHTYNELIDYLLEKSEYKNYKRENVYQLLLDLIGITNVKEFADKLHSYRHAGINKALNDTAITFFSTPLELIQYLLASKDLYDFTESDINNLLLRMILEKGLSVKDYQIGNTDGRKLFKNPKFVSTIVLVNILLIILIIVFYRRSKNNPD
jgi:hypothetical protein